MAAAIHEELNKRSVLVGRVDDRSGTGIHLRTIMSQFLGKPETEIDTDDVEQLFNALTGQGSSHERLVLIIDDAERLLPDVIAYLRLLVSVALEYMPQIVFIGSPPFLEIADQLTGPGFKDLATARFVLEPLNSTSTSKTAEQLIVTPCDALGPTKTTANSNPSPKMAAVAEAMVSLESRIAGPVVDFLPPPVEFGIRAKPQDVLTWLPESIIRRQNRSVARIASAAVLVGTIGAAAYWLAIDRSLPEAKPPAYATIQVRLPSSSASALQAQSEAPSFDSAREFPDTIFARMSETPRALATPRMRPGVDMTPARPANYASPATNGTWLFPPNANGGG
jgi:hypothetical protein